jgi:regulator of protease activity HflC (stomatin/prohibitin superfamily)
MAEIHKYPMVRHLRGDQAAHTLVFRKGRLARSGRGLALWFRPLAAAIAEVPLDDREAPFLFHGRTSDFQQAIVQGVIAFRITNPQQLAERVDFTIDLDTGAWRRTPLEQLSGLLTQLAQELAHSYLAQTELVVSLREGVGRLRGRLTDALTRDQLLNEMGVEVTAVRVATVQPATDMDKALQTPTRESIQQQADQATFARRAQAVEKERAIAENELTNKVELARQEERLIAQEGENAQHRATDEAEALRIATEAAASKRQVMAAAEAAAITAMEGARVNAERDRLAAYQDLPSTVLLGMAAREVAANLGKVEHLYLTPDLLGPLAARLLDGTGGPRQADAAER